MMFWFYSLKIIWDVRHSFTSTFSPFKNKAQYRKGKKKKTKHKTPDIAVAFFFFFLSLCNEIPQQGQGINSVSMKTESRRRAGKNIIKIAERGVSSRWWRASRSGRRFPLESPTCPRYGWVLSRSYIPSTPGQVLQQSCSVQYWKKNLPGAAPESYQSAKGQESAVSEK